MNALELADDLKYVLKYSDSEHWDTLNAVAAELRRLYELAMDQQGKIYALEMARSMQQKTAKLKRDALLEALKNIERSTYDAKTAAMARVAISKAEENA